MGEPKPGTQRGTHGRCIGLAPVAYRWWKNYYDCWSLVPKPAHEAFKGTVITLGEYDDVSVEGLQVKVWFKVGIYEHKLLMHIASLLHGTYHCNGCDVRMGTFPFSK